jgi:hypothetical protein
VENIEYRVDEFGLVGAEAWTKRPATFILAEQAGTHLTTPELIETGEPLPTDKVEHLSVQVGIKLLRHGICRTAEQHAVRHRAVNFASKINMPLTR